MVYRPIDDSRFIEVIDYQDENIDLTVEVYSAAITFIGKQVDP